MQVSTWCKIFDPLVIIGLLVDAMMQRECANCKLYYELAVIMYCDEQRTRADEPQATSHKPQAARKVVVCPKCTASANTTAGTNKRHKKLAALDDRGYNHNLQNPPRPRRCHRIYRQPSNNMHIYRINGGG